MKPTERIEVRKFYIDSVALFGLLYGLIIAIIFALFVLISGLVVPGGIEIGNLVFNTVGLIFALAGLTFVFSIVAVVISFVLGTLIYNLVVRMGVKLSIGLAEYERPPKKLKPSKPQKSSQHKTSSRMPRASTLKKAHSKERVQKKPGKPMASAEMVHGSSFVR